MKVGLVLGGGGSRGLAHIGVLEVLHREGVPVDFIVGTSMGAIIGVLYSLGMHPSEIAVGMMEEMTKENPNSPLRSLSMITSSARQKRLEKLLSPVVGEKTFQNLSLPVVVMAVDMISGTEVQLTRGPLMPALLATSAVPGVFPPVEIDGRHLSDGGVIDSMATHVAFEHGADKLIAVDVYPELESQSPWNDPISDIIGIQWASAFFGNGTADSQRVPNMASVMWRSVRVMTWHLHQKRLSDHPPDIYIRPEVNDIGSLDFKTLAEPIEAGVKAAKHSLQRLRSMLAEPL